MSEFLFGVPKSQILGQTFSTDPYLFGLFPTLAAEQSTPIGLLLY